MLRSARGATPLLTHCSATQGCIQLQQAPDGVAVFGGGALSTVEYDGDLFQGLIKMHIVEQFFHLQFNANLNSSPLANTILFSNARRVKKEKDLINS